MADEVKEEDVRKKYREWLKKPHQIGDKEEFILWKEKFIKEKLKKLYKYRIYNDSNINSLIEDTLWLSSPEYFNDPYDCFGFSLNENFNNLLINEFFKIRIESSQIGCFSEDPKSLLMWSHYADSHKGFCLEYDLSKWDSKITNILAPVIYQNNQEKYFDNEEEVYNIELAFLAKAQEWEYEKEWRLVDQGFSNKLSLKEIKEGGRVCTKLHISAIFLGAKMPENHKRMLIKLAYIKDIEIYQMTLSPTEFQMIPKPIINIFKNI